MSSAESKLLAVTTLAFAGVFGTVENAFAADNAEPSELSVRTTARSESITLQGFTYNTFSNWASGIGVGAGVGYGITDEIEVGAFAAFQLTLGWYNGIAAPMGGFVRYYFYRPIEKLELFVEGGAGITVGSWGFHGIDFNVGGGATYVLAEDLSLFGKTRFAMQLATPAGAFGAGAGVDLGVMYQF